MIASPRKTMTGDWIVKYRNKLGQMMDENFATEEEARAFAEGRSADSRSGSVPCLDRLSDSETR